MDSTDSKKFYRSKTFWFALLYLLVSVAGVFGFAGYQPSADAQEIGSVVSAFTFLLLRLVTSKKITL